MYNIFMSFNYAISSLMFLNNALMRFCNTPNLCLSDAMYLNNAIFSVMYLNNALLRYT